MYLLGILIIIFLYLYLFQKHRDIIKYLPLSKKGVYNLNERINMQHDKGSLYTLYFNMIALCIGVIGLSLLLKLNFGYTTFLVLISISLIPFIIIWNLNFKINEHEFINLTTYLTQFILVFKTNHKVLFALEELVNTLEGRIRTDVEHMIKYINDGQNTQSVLDGFNQKHPHFIVYNLHSLVVSVEKYGSVDYFEALDLIQDDIDDWIDDTHEYSYNKKNLIRKINTLILFAFGICYMALNMLLAIELSTNTALYQSTLFLFCFIQIITFTLSHSVLNMTFLHASETVC